MFTTGELEIIKTSLENDIARSNGGVGVHPALTKWLEDTIKLNNRITNELYRRNAVQSLLRGRD